MVKATVICCFCMLIMGDVVAQIPRERVSPGAPIEDIFWAPKLILTNSVYNVPRRNLNVTIMHSFGIATDGVHNLFGMDDPANIRFGVDYGLTDRLSIGLGRSRFDKLYDARFKANLLRQTQDGRIPIEVALGGTVGVMTLENGFDFPDRLNYFATLMVARQFSNRVAIQIAPMFSHFNDVSLQEESSLFAVGLAGHLGLSRQVALLVEYVPVIGSRSPGTADAFSIGFDIDTGGHVFQIFFTTSQWLTEQHVMARNTDDFFDGNFRLGFNVNRVFGL